MKEMSVVHVIGKCFPVLITIAASRSRPYIPKTDKYCPNARHVFYRLYGYIVPG